MIKIQSQQLQRLGFDIDRFEHHINLSKKLHAVDHVLLSIVLEGQATHHLGDHSYPEKAGSISIIHHGQTHSIVTSKTGISGYNIFLDLQRCPVLQASPKLQEVFSRLLPLHPNLQFSIDRMIRVELSRPDSFRQLLKMLHEEKVNHKDSKDDLSINLLNAFFIELCREAIQQGYQINPSLDAAKIPKPVIRCREYIDQHFRHTIQCESLAKNFNISSSHLRRHFKNYTGKSIIHYLHQRRIQMAMQLLKTNQDSITTIALECGYQEMSFFHRKFKAIVGISPKAYRNQV